MNSTKCAKYLLSVENIAVMQMVKSEEHISGVEACGILLEASDLRKVEEELTSGAVLQDKEQLGLRGEGVVHLDDEGVAHRSLIND